MLRVLMISTFGPKVRGISPYSDSLSSALESTNTIHLDRVDYHKAFPEFLLPDNTDYNACNEYARISYTKPSTWDVTNGKTYDIAHVQYWSPAFLPILIAIIKKLRKQHIKVVITWHNPSPHEGLPLLAYAEKILLSMCDCIICHTKSGSQILKTVAPGKPIEVIHHGCEVFGITTPTQQDFDKCELSPNYDYILYFGNIRPYKGVDMLLDAWKMLADSHKNTKLIIAGRLWENKNSCFSKLIHKVSGTSSYSDLIRKKISTQTDFVITDFQFIEQTKLLSYLNISKYAVFPYLSFESQSGAASLAAGHGCPIITTGVGGLNELAISDEYISPDLTAKSFSKLLEKNIFQYDKKLKCSQIEIAKTKSWSHSAEKHILHYKNISTG